MKKKIKLLTIIGTRPEIIRLSRILPKFDKYFDHTILHTGQNYDENLSGIFFKDLNLRKPDFILENANTNNIKAISKILIETDKIINKIEPDAVFILGDTNSSLSSIVAKKRQIPIFHYEAGNRCFDQRVPEETNRKIVDSISDINLTYSKISREHLINEGFQSNRVINIGSPMLEVLEYFKNKIKKSNILKNLKLKKNTYIVFSSHREENVDNLDNFKNLVNILNFLNETFNCKIVVSVHPRIKGKIKNLDKKKLNKIIFCKPFSFTDYIKLQINSKMVISDSGTINEESSILGFKAINIRNSHERPEADEEGTSIMTGLNAPKVNQAVNFFMNNKEEKINIVNDYRNQNISDKLVKIVMSFVGFINENNYKK
jgi:UDP-N-acetylglucosamine 2-epimerase